MMRLSGWYATREADISEVLEYYHKHGLELFPAAIDFFKSFYGLAANCSSLECGIYKEFFFTLFPEDDDAWHNVSNIMYEDGIIDCPSDDYCRVQYKAQENVLLVGCIGFYYPADVWIGESSKLYATHEYELELRVFDNIFQLIHMELLTNLPTAITCSLPIIANNPRA